ncbi:MAG: VWA domain-containing protein [Candidatus Cloacimonetes bacterium]|nr:VWA domain-containing protein [Candidatus Cloacimonadota bacterium]
MGEVVTWLESQSPENPESEIPKLPLRFAADHDLTEAQMQVLQQMAEMFANYNDTQENLRTLRGIYHLMQKPDTEITVKLPNKEDASPVMLGDIVKLVLGLVKNRFKDFTGKAPEYKTIIKEKLSGREEERSKFDVSASDLEKVRLNFAKRKKTKHTLKNRNEFTSGRGRIIRYSQDESGNIALTPTIMQAIHKGDYSLKRQKFNIQANHFLYPKYEENVVYNVMLVLDTSKSISWVIPHIEKVVSYISANVTNSRDKLGLITFNDDLAQIFHYPTLNVKQVIGTINEMEAKGKTPLGEGLNLAVQVFGREQYKLPGMKNLVILISDCFPEPLEGGYENLFDEPSYKLVISAAEKMRDEKLGFIIINPAADKKGQANWGQKLIEKIVKITQAKYIEVSPTISFNLFRGENAIIEEEKLTELFSAVSDVKVNL